LTIFIVLFYYHVTISSPYHDGKWIRNLHYWTTFWW